MGSFLEDVVPPIAVLHEPQRPLLTPKEVHLESFLSDIPFRTYVRLASQTSHFAERTTTTHQRSL
jgi:hypothetical protein